MRIRILDMLELLECLSRLALLNGTLFISRQKCDCLVFRQDQEKNFGFI